MVSAKDPPKVKIENFHNFKVPELGGNYAYLVYEGLVIFIVV